MFSVVADKRVHRCQDYEKLLNSTAWLLMVLMSNLWFNRRCNITHVQIPVFNRRPRPPISLQVTTLPRCLNGSQSAWTASSSCSTPTSWTSRTSSPRWSARSRTTRTKCAWCWTRRTRSALSSWWEFTEHWCGLWAKSSTHLRWRSCLSFTFVLLCYVLIPHTDCWSLLSW